MGSHRETKLVAIDKPTNDHVVYLGRPGKAARFARQPLDPWAHRQLLPFKLLRITFARDMRFGGQMPGVRSPLIGTEAWDPKGLQPGFELENHFVLTAAKHLRQDLAGPVIKGMPPPTWSLLLAHETPHFVDLRSLHGFVANLH